MNRIFECSGIPQILEPRQEIVAKHLTIDMVETVMKQSTHAIFPVSGDCMERAGVVDRGWVAVDFTRFPALPRYRSEGGDGSADLCMCYAVYPGQRRPAVMVKAYIGVLGPWQMVGTHYDMSKGKHRMNCSMEAQRIFGVIFASWDADGRLLWQRDPDSFPEQLGTAPSIRGGNLGDPIPIRM